MDFRRDIFNAQAPHCAGQSDAKEENRERKTAFGKLPELTRGSKGTRKRGTVDGSAVQTLNQPHKGKGKECGKGWH